MRSFPLKYSILSIMLFSSAFMAGGQEIPEISEQDIPGFSLLRNETFGGGSLWGYMNGGADIYLEYGFDILRVEEFSREDENIKLEFFKMDDPVSAFGIYSIKTFKCTRTEVLTSIDCFNNFQFQLLYGDYYIQLINESGNDRAKQYMIDLAETLLKKIEHDNLTLPLFYLTDSLNIPLTDIKLLKGELGIQEKAPEFTGYFEGIADYKIFYAKPMIDGGKQKYYEIVFDTPEMKHMFLQNTKNLKPQILSINNNNILIVLSH